MTTKKRKKIKIEDSVSDSDAQDSVLALDSVAQDLVLVLDWEGVDSTTTLQFSPSTIYSLINAQGVETRQTEKNKCLQRGRGG